MVAEPKGLVHHQEKPPPRHREHAVPHEPLRGSGQLETPEGAGGSPPRHSGRVAQRLGEALERVIEGEGEVPRLGREDHEDRGELEPDVPGREQGHEAQYEAGQEAEHGNALQDVEQRQQQPFRDARLRRRPAEPEREHVGDQQRDHTAREGEERVLRERDGAQVDVDRLQERRPELAGERDHGGDGAADQAEHHDVGEPDASQRWRRQDEWKAKRLQRHAVPSGATGLT